VTQTLDTGDRAMLEATGRMWREWRGILDHAEMRACVRAEVMNFLGEEHFVPLLWQGVIARRYELSGGRMADDHQFEAGVTRTLDLSAVRAYEAWAIDERRSKWLRRGDFEPASTSEPSSVCGKWLPDGSKLEIEIADTGDGRCTLNVRHSGLSSSGLAEKMRDFWIRCLDRLADRMALAS
jgi:hypothetical protein